MNINDSKKCSREKYINSEVKIYHETTLFIFLHHYVTQLLPFPTPIPITDNSFLSKYFKIFKYKIIVIAPVHTGFLIAAGDLARIMGHPLHK